MTDRTPRKPTKAATRNAETGAPTGAFTDEERAAMRERARETKRDARPSSRASKADGARDVVAKIAEMAEPDRIIGERLHAIITTVAPELSPKLWYGMPAYARDGRIVCFFQCARKFKTRYATLGFTDAANLDEGPLWPTAFAVVDLTEDVEARIGALVKKAVS